MKNLTAVLTETAFGGIDESLKEFYTQNSENKNYYLNLPDTEAEKIAFGLQRRFDAKKTALDTLHKDHNELKERHKPFEEFGKTVDEIKAELANGDTEEVGKIKADFETQKTNLKKSYDEDLKKREASYQESLKQAQDQANADRAEIEHIVMTAEIEKLKNDFRLNDTASFVLRDHLKPVRNDETGKYSVSVIENGEPAMVAGMLKSPAQLLEGFRENGKFLSMFNAQNGGGSGASNMQGKTPVGGKSMRRTDWEQRSNAGEDFTEFFAGGGKIID